jgi:hypothetical protein
MGPQADERLSWVCMGVLRKHTTPIISYRLVQVLARLRRVPQRSKFRRLSRGTRDIPSGSIPWPPWNVGGCLEGARREHDGKVGAAPLDPHRATMLRMANLQEKRNRQFTRRRAGRQANGERGGPPR